MAKQSIKSVNSETTPAPRATRFLTTRFLTFVTLTHTHTHTHIHKQLKLHMDAAAQLFNLSLSHVAEASGTQL